MGEGREDLTAMLEQLRLRRIFCSMDGGAAALAEMEEIAGLMKEEGGDVRAVAGRVGWRRYREVVSRYQDYAFAAQEGRHPHGDFPDSPPSRHPSSDGGGSARREAERAREIERERRASPEAAETGLLEERSRPAPPPIPSVPQVPGGFDPLRGRRSGGDGWR